MNVLLVNPNREQMPWPAVPVGLSMVATAIRRAGHEVALLDLTFSKSPRRDVLAAVRERAPDVLGITVRNIDNCNFESPVFYLTEIRDAVVRACREAAPSTKVVVGGSAVNVSPWEVLHYLEADLAVVGEGEEAMPSLLRAMAAGEDVAGVQGTLVRNGDPPVLDEAPAFGGDRSFRGEPKTGRAIVADLEVGLRSEAFRWVDLRKYSERGGPYSIQTKRGCALRCVYCVYNNIEGRTYRLRDPRAIVDEIEEVARDHGVRHVDFVDSTFNLPTGHTMALCEELAARPMPQVELSTMGLNPAATSPELLAAMKRAGFKSVMCTPESASDVTLKSLQKGYKKDAVVRAARHIRDANLRTFWFFMFGAPGETTETVRETLAFCDENIPKSDVVLFTTGIRVYAGTPLEKQCKEIGWFEPDDPLLSPSWYLSPQIDLSALYDLLVTAARKHPNWMTNAETILSPGMATAMKKGMRLLGMRGPFWQHLPKLFNLTTRLGVRQRTLDENRARVTSDSEVRHRLPIV